MANASDLWLGRYPNSVYVSERRSRVIHTPALPRAGQEYTESMVELNNGAFYCSVAITAGFGVVVRPSMT